MWFQREFSDEIRRAAQKFPVIVLTGARQAGKTALLRSLFPSHRYVSLDLPSAAAMAEKDPTAFFERNPAPLLVDEVQYAPQLFRHLKSEVDAARHEMGRFILTGSQKFVLMREVADSLAGRCAVLDLETLSAREIASQTRRPEGTGELAALVARGGFPELWRDPEIPRDVFFASYLATYLERDLRQILNVSSLRDFERFIRACAARSGQLLNKSALAGEVGVSVPAITSWLSALEASNQIAFLEPWFPNFGKRLVKSPKLYLSDTGLLCHLLGVTADNLLASPFVGAVWETFVFAELRKALRVSASPASVWFYRDKQQVEVDFLVLGGGRGRLVECKWTELPDEGDTRSLRAVSRIAAEKRLPDFADVSSFVVCRTASAHPVGTDTRAIGIMDITEELGL